MQSMKTTGPRAATHGYDGRQFRLYTMHPDVRVYFPRDAQKQP